MCVLVLIWVVACFGFSLLCGFFCVFRCDVGCLCSSLFAWFRCCCLLSLLDFELFGC